MGWTDEKVELLKKLWQEGLSAKQISKQLGGVTRNAVLGKIHRLGLSGRAMPSKPARTVFRAPRPMRTEGTVAPSAPRRLRAPGPGPVHASDPGMIIGALPEPVQKVDEVSGTATNLTLGKHMCRWPIGDPALQSFTFCGRAAEGSYCHEHLQVACKPAQKKYDPEAMARSLRPYL